MEKWVLSLETLGSSILPILPISIFATSIGVLAAVLDQSNKESSGFQTFSKATIAIILLLGLFIPQPILYSTLNLTATAIIDQAFTQSAFFQYFQSVPYLSGLSFLLASTILQDRSVISGPKLYLRNSNNIPFWSNLAISTLSIRYSFFFIWGICILVIVLKGKVLGQEGYVGTGEYLMGVLRNPKPGEPLQVFIIALFVTFLVFVSMYAFTKIQAFIARLSARLTIGRTSKSTFTDYFIFRNFAKRTVVFTTFIFGFIYALVLLRLVGGLGSPFERSLPSFQMETLGKIIFPPDLGVIGAFSGSLTMLIVWSLLSMKILPAFLTKEKSLKNTELMYLCLGLLVFIPSEFVGAFILSFNSWNWAWSFIYFGWGFLSGLAMSALLVSSVSSKKDMQRYINLKHSTSSRRAIKYFVKEYRAFMLVVLFIAMLHNGFDGGLRSKLGWLDNTVPGEFLDNTGGGFSEIQQGLALSIIGVLCVLLILFRLPTLKLQHLIIQGEK